MSRDTTRGAGLAWEPTLIRESEGPSVSAIRVGHPLVDDYLEFVGARARTNTWLACAYDLKVFFSVVAKEPVDVTTADVFEFIKAQRQPRRGGNVIRFDDAESGLAARTIKRRLSSVSGLFGYLLALDVVKKNPVPRGLAARRPRGRRGGGIPLIRTPRTVPRVLSPSDANSFLAALRTHRDRAMVLVMLLGGLRRCEALGLRLGDVNAGEKRVFVAEGKGGHQRRISVSGRFFESLGRYLETERPPTEHDHVFVVLKGPRLGHPLSAAGLDQIVSSARDRAGLGHVTCHQLRHTCLTRLREAGMSLEAVQAQAGHRSIVSTRIYLHLGDAWVAEQYAIAVDALDELLPEGVA